MEPGNYKIKMADYQLLGPASMATDLPAFSEGELGIKQTLVRTQDGAPRAGVPYRSVLADGTVIEGKTDANGETAPIDSARFHVVETRFTDDKRDQEQ